MPLHSLSSFDCHTHPVFRSQRDQRFWRDLASRNEVNSPTRRQRREHENCFGPRKAFPNTTPRPAAKWKVGVLGSGLLAFGRPSVRIEASRIRKKSWVPLRNKGTQQDD